MKTFIKIAALLALTSPAFARTLAEEMNKLCEIETQNKIAWIEFMTKETEQKAVLIKDGMLAGHKAKSRFISDVSKAKDGIEIQDIINKHLKKAVENAKIWHEKWKQWAEQNRTKANALCAKHEEIFNSFVESLGSKDRGADMPDDVSRSVKTSGVTKVRMS
jgi:hypothetical protein